MRLILIEPAPTGGHRPIYVRSIAEAIQAGREPPEGAFDFLRSRLARIHRRSWKEQAVASWCLGRLPLTDTEQSEAAGTLVGVLRERPNHSVGCMIASGCLFYYIGFIWIIYTSAMDGIVNKVRAAAAESNVK